jgi:acyl-CoA thioesterase I
MPSGKFPRRIVAIGASTCEGKVDPAHGGYVGQLRQWLEQQDDRTHVFNLGIAGDTSSGVLQRLPVEIPPRRPEVIIFQFGSNDAARQGGRLAPITTSLAQFRDNLRSILTTAKDLAPHVVFLSVCPPDPLIAQETPWGASFFLEDAKQYTAVTAELCRQLNIDYLDAFNEWLSGDYRHLLHHDGVHPNTEGHRELFKMVKKWFELQF